MAAPAPAPGKRKGTKITPMTMVIVLGVALAAGAFFLWRQRSSASSANNAAAAATPNNEDVAGQIATLQAEIADLQSSGAQDEAGESGTGTPPGSTPGKLAAPAGLSITPKASGADFGWSKVAGASAYELQVTPAGGKGTGTSHYDHAGTGTHAAVSLAKGAYKARVRAGTSTALLTGPWTPYKSFSVGTSTIKVGGKPPQPTPQPGGGESEAA